MRELGIDFTFLPPEAAEEQINAAFQENTRCVFIESLSNPALVVADISLYAKLAHSHGVPLIVDNTFPTPINCRPFEFGADIVAVSYTHLDVYKRQGKAYLHFKQGDRGDCRQAERRLSIGLRERWGNGSGFRPRPNSFCRLGRAGRWND